MSFPTANLVARYEPRLWGYSDGDVINTTTKKIQDSSGNGNHLADYVSGTHVLYKTNILNGAAAVQFPGAHGDPGYATGLFATGSTAPGTVAALIIPREIGVVGIAWCFHDGGAGGGAAPHNGVQAYIATGPYIGYWSNAAGVGFASTTSTAPAVGRADRVGVDYAAPAATNHLRVNTVVAGTVAAQNLYAGMLRFTIGGLPPLAACWQFDLLALFIYSSVLSAGEWAQLDAYLDPATFNLTSDGSAPTDWGQPNPLMEMLV